MNVEFDDAEISEREVVAVRRQRDFDDLQNEMAGNETGRMVRFLPEAARGHDTAEKRKAERAEMLTRLQLMMQDPAYAKLYNDTMNRLAEAERATEIALTKALERQRQADEALAELRDRALKLEDGRRVYRDESGVFRTEDGLAVSDSEMGASAEHWHPGMPGFADYDARRDAAAAEAATVDELREYQTDTLGAARDRMTDQRRPPQADEVEMLGGRIADEMPEQARRELRGPDQIIPVQPSASMAMDIPKL